MLNSSRQIFVRAAAIFLLSFFAKISPLAAAEPVRVSNSFLQIGVSAKDGSVLELIDVQTKQNEIAAAQNKFPLWELETVSGTERGRISSAQAKSFRHENLNGTEPGLRLVWEDFGIEAAPNLRVEVRVILEAGVASSDWNIAVENLGKLRLSEVHFPRINGLQKRENEYLTVPSWLGTRAANPRRLLVGENKKGSRVERDYPGHLSLQCFAFGQENGPGFYAACDDTNALRKNFAFWGNPNGDVNYEMIHQPENSATPLQRYAPPYSAVLGTFTGDWFTAAERYRRWGTNQVWAKESRLQKGATPKWASETAMWVWNRGRSENVLVPAEALQKELDLPVSVFWHWWHGCAYDTGFPEYFPPREGTEPFKKAVARARKKDIHEIVYMNQRLWGMTTASWTNENAEYFAVKNASGKVHPEVYNIFTKQPCASMCMGTAFWRNKYAGLAERAFHELKVDGIYMDQACSSLACYDPNHGHALGGGAYWMNGFRKLSTDIRERCNVLPSSARPFQFGKRKVVLAGEGCGEAWLPYLDLMLALQVARERYSAPNDGWEVIPFFTAVYHPFAILYGNYSSLTMPPYDDLWPEEFAPKEPLKLLDRKYSRQFYLEQARSFVWGQQPTIANFMASHLRDRPEETEYMMRLARIRNRATKFLLHGTFLRPPELKVPEATLDLSRLSIYAGQKGGITSSLGKYPVVIGGSWRATDGNIGIALASIADEPMTIPLNIEAGKKSGTIYRIDEHGRKKLGKWKEENPHVAIELPARGACVVEFSGK